MVEATHLCPAEGEAVTPCCGLTIFELPRTDRITLDASRVACPPTPSRIQRRRTKGWKMPEGAVYVGRPSRWGNPLPGGIKGLTPEQCVTGYRDLIVHRKATLITADSVVTIRATDVHQPMPTADEVRDALAGRVLACWCVPGAHCHGDALVEIANSPRDMVRVLHLSGSRRDRQEAEAVTSTMVRTADKIVHHWRPWTHAKIVQHRVMPNFDGPRDFKWLHLGVIGALMLVLGVVVYQTWLAGTAVAP